MINLTPAQSVAGVTPHEQTEAEKSERQRLLELVEATHYEANEFRRDGDNGLSLEAQWEQNGHRYLGNHWYAPVGGTSGLVEGFRVIHFANTGQDTAGLQGLKRTTINRIQTSTISNVAGMTQSPFVITLAGTQQSEDTEFMLSPRGGSRIARLRDAHIAQVEQYEQALEAQATQIEAGQAAPPQMEIDQQLLSFDDDQLLGPKENPELGPTRDLTGDQAVYVRQLIANAVIEKSDLIEINDGYIARRGQQVFDNRWELAMGDAMWTLNEFYCCIFGHCPMRIQFHDSGPMKDRISLHNEHVFHVWLDPAHDAMEFNANHSDYGHFHHHMSFAQAVATWPQHRAAFERAKRSGKLEGGRTRAAGVYRRTNFKREMVTVRTSWLRYQPIPMTVEEAMKEGTITPVTEPDTDAMAAMAAEGVVLTDENIPQAITGYTLTATSEPIAEGEKDWPVRYGLLQVVSLPQISEIVDVQECPYLDMPIAWNINIPRIYDPYGQGEPQRLEDIQQQINRLCSIFGNYLGYYQFPARYWKASVLEKILALNVDIQMRPGAEIPLPDDEYDALVSQGKPCMTHEPVPWPAEFTNYLQMLLGEIDRMAGNSDVRQGVAPFSGASGELVQQLRTEAYGPLALRARFTEWAVERCARIMLDAIVKFMTEDTWMEILDDLSPVIIEKIRRRLESSRFDFTVAAAQGRGTTKEQEGERAVVLHDKGLLSTETTMSRVGVEDVPEELNKIRQQQAAMAGTPPAAA